MKVTEGGAVTQAALTYTRRIGKENREPRECRRGYVII